MVLTEQYLLNKYSTKRKDVWVKEINISEAMKVEGSRNMMEVAEKTINLHNKLLAEGKLKTVYDVVRKYPYWQTVKEINVKNYERR